tara:strand:- start:3828 stop:4109 length:282 start_codon:yes stop_codon:yes gene_type:complete
MKEIIKKHYSKEIQWLIEKSVPYREHEDDEMIEKSYRFKGSLPHIMRSRIRKELSGRTAITTVNLEDETVSANFTFNPYTGYLVAFFSRAIAK